MRSHLLPEGTLRLCLSFGSSFVVSLWLTSLIAATTGPIGFGNFTTFSIACQLLLGIQNFGFYSSTILVFDKAATWRRKHALFKSRYFASIHLFLALAIILLSLGFFCHTDKLYYFFLVITFLFINAIQPMWVFILERRYTAFAILTFLQRFGQLCLTLLMLKFSSSDSIACLALALSPAFSLVAFHLLAKRYNTLDCCNIISRRSFENTLRLIKSEYAFAANDLTSQLTFYTGNLLLAGFAGSSIELGYYTLADRIRSYMLTLFSPFISSKYNSISMMLGSGQIKEGQKSLNIFITAAFSAGTIMSVILFLKSDYIIASVAGPRFLSASTLLKVSALYLPFSIVNIIMHQCYYTAQRLSHALVLGSVVKLVLSSILFLSLIKLSIGLSLSALCASLSSEIISSIILFKSTFKFSKLRLYGFGSRVCA